MAFCFAFFSEMLPSSLDSPLALFVTYLYPAENMTMEEADQLCKLSWTKHSVGYLDANTEVSSTA